MADQPGLNRDYMEMGKLDNRSSTPSIEPVRPQIIGYRINGC